MQPLRFDQARAVVFDRVRDQAARPAVETIPLDDAAGRVLAVDVFSDRDYPPFDRSARDGYAVIAEDVQSVPATLDVIGETPAGVPSPFSLERGEAVEIMTGAPGPRNADAVVMVEYSERRGGRVTLSRPIASGRNLIIAGSEVRRGQRVMTAGTRISYAVIALLATVGHSEVQVFRRPRVAILSTGDEVLPIDAEPASHQIRNSNAHSLAAQVRRRGAVPEILPIARDTVAATRRLVVRGLESDLLLLSGGVSMGKHDVVEEVLTDQGAELFFTKVRIQPGKPLVFARCGETPVFGLPGNPLSTMVTFEVFASVAVDLLAGASDSPMPFSEVPLAEGFRHKPVLTRFLGARLEGSYAGTTVRIDRGGGSGDVAAFARANCLVVATDDRSEWEAGDPVRVMPL